MRWPFQIFVEGRPATAGSKNPHRAKRTGRLYVTDSCKGKAAWMLKVAAAAREAWQQGPFDGPVEMEMWFFVPRPLSHYRVVGRTRVLRDDAPFWHVSKPDRTKLVRAAEDALVGILWKDDSQVVAGPAYKLWGNVGGALIRVRPMKAKVIDPLVLEILQRQPEPIRDTTRATGSMEDFF